MQPGASTFPCPNCGRPLPPHARFCGDCGKPVAQAQAATPAAQPVFPSPTPAQAQVATPAQEDLATVIDPNFQPLSSAQVQVAAPPASAMPAAGTPAPSLGAWYPTQQAAPSSGFQSQAPAQFSAPASGFQAQAPTNYGQPGMGSPAPVQFPTGGELPRRRSFLSTPAGKIALFFLVIVVVGGGVGVFFIVRGLGATNAANLPGDVPLPANSTFVKKVDQTWYYTVANTTLQQVQDFYTAQLSQKGWPEPNILGSTGSLVLISCKTNQEIKVVGDASTPLGGVAPPSGGVVLKIVLQPPAQADCSLQ